MAVFASRSETHESIRIRKGPEYVLTTIESCLVAAKIKHTAAAAAAKSLQLCLTLRDPIDGSPPGSPSLGFSRQEHWSGLPFPSPMHESEK